MRSPGIGSRKRILSSIALAASAIVWLCTSGALAQSDRGADSGALQIDELCNRIGAKGIAPADLESFAQSLGIPSSEVPRLRACAQQGASPSASSLNPDSEPPGLDQRPPAPSNAPSEALSNIERGFTQLADPGRLVETPEPLKLRQFGYSLFASKVSSFAPVDNVPVGDDYTIGPGDELNLLMWGRVNQTVRLKVQRDGSILVPELGPMQLAGLKFGQARDLLASRAGQITGVQVDVTMGRLRTIQIFVIGEVSQPGAYTVSSLARVSNGLIAAGGVSKVGSLRRVELRRGNSIARVIDLYDLLLYGDTANDLALQPQDAIFVPVIGAVAGVVGDVKRPAIYELTGRGATLDGLLKLAGGTTAFAYTHRIQVERIENHQRMIARDVGPGESGANGFAVHDGDLVRVYAVLPQQNDVVYLKGNVRRPGTFQWRQGMRVSDLVRMGEGLAPNTFLKYAVVRRNDDVKNRAEMVPVDLESALAAGGAGASDIKMRPRDELIVYSESELAEFPTVRVVGEVRKPGIYPLTGGMRVSDLIYRAGGLESSAYQERAELAATRVIDGAHTVRVNSQIDLRSALSGSLNANRALERDDVLFIRRVPDFHLPWIVTVRGEVTYPGPYSIAQGERLSSVLRRSGGFLSQAYLPAAVFTRASVRESQAQRLKEARARIQQELARLQLMPTAAGAKETANAPELAMLQKAITTSEEVQPLGRIVLRLKPLDQLPNSPDDVELADRDELVVPKRPASVSVLGQVYNPTALVYETHLTLRDYLSRAGGPTNLADDSSIMVIRVDGSVLTENGFMQNRKSTIFPLLPLVSAGLMDARLGPGDTIYVPEKLVFVDNVEFAKDIAQIAANAAAALATVGLLAFAS